MTASSHRDVPEPDPPGERQAVRLVDLGPGTPASRPAPDDLELADLIDAAALQRLMDDFYAVARVPMSLLDARGHVLVGVGWQDICTLFHRVHPEMRRACLESDTELSAGLAPGEVRLYRCKNNMWDMATPVTVAGRHLGNVFSGQFFFEDEPVDRELFREQARHRGVDEEAYLAALDRVPRLSRETLRRSTAFFVGLADMLSRLGHSNAQLARALAERDRLTTSLRESERRLARAQAIAHLGSWELDPERNALTWSDEVFRIFGLRPSDAEMSYEAFLKHVHPDDREAVNAAFSNSLASGSDGYEVEHRVVRAQSGEVRHVREKCQHVRDGDGRVVRSLGMVLDITGQKRAEAQADAFSGQRRLALDAAGMGWWHFDPATGVATWDEGFRRIVGVTGDRSADRELHELLGPDDRDDLQARIEAALDPENPRPLEVRYPITRPDGAERWVDARGIVAFEGHGEARRAVAFAGTVADITERVDAEAALRRLSHFPEENPNPVLRISEHGALMYANAPGAAWLAGLGWGEDQALPEPVVALAARAMETSGPVQAELDAAEGRTLSVSAVRPAGEQYVNLYCSDVTERIRTEAALREALARAEEGDRLLCALLSHVPVGITMCDANLNLLRVSRHGRELLGGDHERLSTGEVTARWPVLRPEGGTPMPEDELPLTRAVRRGEVVDELELVQVNARGEEVPLLCNAAPVRDAGGAITGGIVVWRDISERKRAERAMREANERLRRADRRKDAFLAVLSHELRNPLAPIRNALFILDRVPPGSEQARAARTILDRQTGHLARLVDDLLDVTRITRGKLRLQRERLDLRDLLRDVAQDHREVMAGAGVAFEAHLGEREVWVNGDRARLTQAVGNLLSNAAKFGGRGERVALTLELAQGGGAEGTGGAEGVARVSVRDTGSGIDAELLPELFVPFMQADRTLDRSKGGLGLGLALVKGVVDLHGGEVGAYSDGPGTGATFTVTLPLDAEQHPAGARPADAGADADRGAGLRVLIVEDNVDAARTLRLALEVLGHRVWVAGDGPSGVDLAREVVPDAVVCDIGLPGLDGFGVARALRAEEALRGALLVALSGYARPEDLAAAREAGFNEHLSKPANLDRLTELLGRIGER